MTFKSRTDYAAWKAARFTPVPPLSPNVLGFRLIAGVGFFLTAYFGTSVLIGDGNVGTLLTTLLCAGIGTVGSLGGFPTKPTP